MEEEDEEEQEEEEGKKRESYAVKYTRMKRQQYGGIWCSYGLHDNTSNVNLLHNAI